MGHKSVLLMSEVTTSVLKRKIIKILINSAKNGSQLQGKKG
jgi:hypothetical protein